MSRSRKKTPVKGITSAKSEKEDKRNANRKFRRKVKQEVNKGGEEQLPKLRELSNVWAFDKDGKRYDKDLPEKSRRK
ncbi:MAG: hypothetical protein AAGA66_11160 [Bacteroidota bacterium]